MANKLAREKATDNLLDNILHQVKFVHDPPNSVLCMLCNKVLKRPIQISCGHRCCQDCDKDIMEESDGTRLCPIDKELIEYQFPDVSALTELMNLHCFCKHSQDGCEWQGPLLQLEHHLKGECAFRGDFKCKFSFLNCSFVGGKKALDEHVKKGNVLHNALLSTHLFDVIEKCEQGHKNMDILMNRTKNLEQKLNNASGSLRATADALEETENFIQSNGLDSVSLHEWQKQIERRLNSIGDTQFQIQNSEGSKLIAKIQQQHSKLNDIFRNKPDIDELINLKKTIQNKMSILEKTSKQHHSKISETDLKFRLFQAATFDGHYIWKLDNLKNRMLTTSTGEIEELYTPPLYTDSYGYKFSIKVLLYGDPKERAVAGGYSSNVDYIAFYVIVMKGDYDEILNFPFPYQVHIALRNLSNKKDISRTIIPDNRIYFRRPYEDMNPAIGFPKFVSHDSLYSEGFVKDDAIYVEIKVDKDRRP